MSRYEYLPLYRASYALCLYAHEVQSKLPKGLRYTVGLKLLDACVESLRLIVVANRAAQKSGALDLLILEIEGLWVFSRLLYDFRGISSGEFKVLSERLAGIQSQVDGWLKWDRKQR